MPRQCGIATFSADLARALTIAEPGVMTEAVAMSDHDGYVYPDTVCFEIQDIDRSAYHDAAKFINGFGFDVLSVQHEYGIFGGDAGSYLLDLVREVKMPVVTTLHTVLREPSASQREVLEELLELSERVVVMSQKAVEFLIEIHGVEASKIDFIPHGIPQVKSHDSSRLREKLGIEGPMILTFGLLSPDKGLEYGIQAMPRIIEKHPGATYVIVGATHPHVRASVGEAYRESLVQLTRELGLQNSVLFIDRFVSSDELIDYLSAMDIYVTPYLNPHQITSGTLAFSVGAGKAVISTPYWYAEEMLADGRGVLVPFRDGDAIADAVLKLQDDPEGTRLMGKAASEFGKKMLWPAVGAQYYAAFSQARLNSSDRLKDLVKAPPSLRPQREELPALNLKHLFEISDDTGVLQHATFSTPNRSEGYCVDDNARALLLTSLLESSQPLSHELSLLQSRTLSFVLAAFNKRTGRFRNFMSYGREWLEESGSEDSHGRSMWALGTLSNRCHDSARRSLAKVLFAEGLSGLESAKSLRTWAYGILGCVEYLEAFPEDVHAKKSLQSLALRLNEAFVLNADDAWPWFEQSLTYANARLPQALIVAGQLLDERTMINRGLRSLAWLMLNQTDANGLFCPVGTNGFYERGSQKALFDQQPIEAWASVSACHSAQKVSGDAVWADRADLSFRWFLGENALNQPVFDLVGGGCHDGLHEKRINENQGAESTLAFLCALTEMRHEQDKKPRLQLHMGQHANKQV